MSPMRGLMLLLVSGLVAAGILVAEGQITGEPLPLSNLGFEQGLSKWVIPAQFSKAISTSSTARSGTSSAMISNAADSVEAYTYRRAQITEPVATYRLAAWARRLTGASATVGVKIEFYNNQGENTNGYWFRQDLATSNNWTQLEVAADADADTVRADILIAASGKGTVVFDDVSFEQVQSAPDFTVLDPLSVVASQGLPSLKNLAVWLKNPPTGQAQFSAVLSGSRVRLRTTAQQLDDHQYQLATRLPPLHTGHFNIDVSSDGTASPQPVKVFVTPQLRKPGRLSSNGAVFWRGKPFFPIGIYNVNHTDDEYSLLAENGFNMVQGDFTLDIQQFKQTLDLALRHNIAVDVPLYANNQVKENLAISKEKIRVAASHPAVIAWKILDEPDADQNRALRDQVCSAYLALKALRPPQPLELTLSVDASLPYWTRFSDMVQIDRYPVPGQPLTQVSDFCRNAKAVMHPWQNLTFVVQCGWTSDLSTQPTFAQARAMVYLALINGAKGISWYSRQDAGWDLTTTPLWPRMKEINAEIKSLAPVLLSGRHINSIQCSEPQVQFAGRKFRDRLYLLVTNPGDTSVTATFTLPSRFNVRSASLLDTGAPVTMSGSTVQLSLAAVESHTVVFEL